MYRGTQCRLLMSRVLVYLGTQYTTDPCTGVSGYTIYYWPVYCCIRVHNILLPLYWYIGVHNVLLTRVLVYRGSQCRLLMSRVLVYRGTQCRLLMSRVLVYRGTQYTADPCTGVSGYTIYYWPVYWCIGVRNILLARVLLYKGTQYTSAPVLVYRGTQCTTDPSTGVSGYTMYNWPVSWCIRVHNVLLTRVLVYLGTQCTTDPSTGVSGYTMYYWPEYWCIGVHNV